MEATTAWLWGFAELIEAGTGETPMAVVKQTSVGTGSATRIGENGNVDDELVWATGVISEVMGTTLGTDWMGVAVSIGATGTKVSASEVGDESSSNGTGDEVLTSESGAGTLTSGSGVTVVINVIGLLGMIGARHSSSSKNVTSSTGLTGDGAQGAGINSSDGYVTATAVQCQESPLGVWRNDNCGGVTTMVLKSGRVAEQPVPDIVNKTRISRLRDMGNSDGDGKVLVANGVHEFDFQTLSTQADHFDRPRVCAIGDEPDCRCHTWVFVTPQRVRLSDPNWPVLTKDAVLRQNRIGAEGLHGLHLWNVKRDN